MYVQNLLFGMHISLRHEAHGGSPATWSNASLLNANGGKRAPAKLSRKVYEAAVSERETMIQMVTRIIKLVSIPVLLIASIFARYAAGYEFLVNLAICLGAVVLVQRAVQLKRYYWAAGFVLVAAVFSPLSLVVKIFLLMGLTCTATFVTLFAAFRTHPSPADQNNWGDSNEETANLTSA